MNNTQPTLPSKRAFVVQFRAPAGPTSDHCAGRVEHLVSGQAALFDSPEELLTFMTTVLSHMGAQASRQFRRGGGA